MTNNTDKRPFFEEVCHWKGWEEQANIDTKYEI